MRPALVITLLGSVLLPANAFADPPSYLDRGLVAEAARRAIERAGLAPDATRALATRSRMAAWLPQLTVRIARGAGASATQYAAPAANDRFLTDDSLLVDVRVTLGLDRLVFDPHEVALARTELTRAERRLALEASVVELLGRLERVRLARRPADLDRERALELDLEFARARARLELLTGVALDALTPR